MTTSAPPRRAKTAADLQWHDLLAILGAHCVGEEAGRRMRALTPETHLAAARARMTLTAEALHALEYGQPVPAAAVPDLREELLHIQRGGVASGESLASVGRTLAVAEALRRYSQTLSDLPALSETLTSSPALSPLRTHLIAAIDAQGLVMDGASPELRQARQEQNHWRRVLSQKLAELARKYADVLRDGNPIERDGRFGLPVRSDSHRRIDGIVLGASASGATLYIEPRVVAELTGKLKLAEVEVERRELQVLAQLSSEVQALSDEVIAAQEACVQADLLAALCRWAQQSEGVALIVGDQPALDLHRCRHPLLVCQPAEVVPADLRLEAGQAMVISGPNAGGKTVALKCLGLITWMACAGIPLTVAASSTIGWMPTVLTEIGDEQSLARSLSTFSAQVVGLSEIIERSERHVLVLLDEVAGGTDPEEGSALAAAVLEAMVTRGAAVATTTHYERLKEMASNDPRFINASVGFDFERLEPTFSLTLGVPGASSALAVAGRFGMPPAVVSRAQALLPQPTIKREELLAAVERERQGLQRAREAAEADQETIAALRLEAEEERRTVRQRERKRIADESSHLVADVRQARLQLQELRAELRGTKDQGKLRETDRRIDQAARLVSLGGPAATSQNQERPPLQESSLAIGSRVYHLRLQADVEVIGSVERGQVEVRAGSMTMRAPISQLRGSTHKAQPKAQPKAQKRKPAPVSEGPSAPSDLIVRTEDNTCDLRGQRVDEALDELERFIDTLIRGADPHGFVLHGHGTGALKQAVREQLALSSQISRSRPGATREGGDAFTVFWLRD